MATQSCAATPKTSMSVLHKVKRKLKVKHVNPKYPKVIYREIETYLNIFLKLQKDVLKLQKQCPFSGE